jgi:hypothetical protein
LIPSPDPAICGAGVGRTWSSPTWSGPEGSSHNDFATGRSGSYRFPLHSIADLLDRILIRAMIAALVF